MTLNAFPYEFPYTGASMGAERYGRYFWSLILPDGREVRCFADRVDVSSSGTLTFWQDTRRDREENRIPLENGPCALAHLAAGAWVSVAIASIMDGHAVFIDYIIPVTDA